MKKKIHLIFIVCYLFNLATAYGQTCQNYVQYATLPYAQGFENWVNLCDSLDAPDSSWINTPASGDYSWRRDDQGMSAGGWDFENGSTYPAYQGSHFARFNIYANGGTSGDLDLHLNCSNAGTALLTFYYINQDNGGDGLTVYVSTDSGTTFNQIATYGEEDDWTQFSLLVVSNSPKTIIRFSATSDYNSYDIGLDSLNVTALPACTGTPDAGTPAATIANGCTPYPFVLSIDPILESGISYQWQSSPDSSNWTNITGATSNNYNDTVNATAYYRIVVACSGSNLSDTSMGVKLQLDTPVATVATLPFFEGFENWIGTCYNYDRPGVNWLTSPTTGNNSWRRDDQGTDAGWNHPNIGTYAPAFSEGAHSARIHTARGPYLSQGNMDLYINMGAIGSKAITFDYTNEHGNGAGYLTVSLSTDSGATFTQLAQYSDAAVTWTPETIITTDTASYAIIRFQETSYYGQPDIGIDSLSVSLLPLCTGVPAVGTIAATETFGCVPPYTSVLSIGSLTTGSGITYQWQSSTDSVNWTNISGATNQSYSVDVYATAYYRIYVTCSNSNLSDSSAGVLLLMVPEVATTATLPFFEGFENWISGCYDNDRPGINWLTNPTYDNPTNENNAWRRDDQGASAGWDFGSYVDNIVYSPASIEGSHSARFHSSNSGEGFPGSMDLYINLNAPGTKVISFDYIKNSDPISSSPSTGSLTVLLSTDGGNTFTPLDTFYNTATWTAEMLTTTATSSNAIIRFLGTGDGNSDLGIDNLNVYVSQPCTGTPVANTPSANQIIGCTPYASQLSTAPVLAGGISYQWQSSFDSVNWVTIAGATTTLYTTPVNNATTYYRVYAVCANSSLADTTAGIKLLLDPATYVATLPYFQGFENWTSGCFLYNRPDSNWTTIPSYGDASWRRDDQGDDAGWSFSSFGVYTPNAIEGTHSARVHNIYGNAAGDTIVGRMDLHINLNVPGTKYISFDYICSNGIDSLEILLSADGGITFTSLGTFQSGDVTGNTGWAQETITTTNTAANTIIRFQASGVNTSNGSDIGLDSLYIGLFPPCTGTPAVSTPTASQTLGCPPSYSSVLSMQVVASGVTYQWQSSPDSVNWTNVAGATAAADTVLITAQTYYRIYVSCVASGLADTSAGIKLSLGTPVFTVATLPFFEGFENWIGGCYNYDRPGANWTTIPSYTDSSWRRNDEGADAGWDNLGSGQYSPSSTEGAHSARFHTTYGSAIPGTQGNMDLHISLNTPGIKYIAFDDFTGYNASLTVLLSTDNGNTFTILGTYTGTPGWLPEFAATTSNSPDAIIRFQATAAGQSNDLGIDSLSIYAVPCTNYISKTITANGPLDFCQGSVASVALSANATAGNTYQWLLDGSDISGATSAVYGASQSGVYSVVLANTSIVGTCPDTSFADTVIVYPLPAPTVSQVGSQLTTGSYTSYQWYLGSQAISGATAQSYTPTAIGVYYVVVADSNGCSNQSANYTVFSVGVPILPGLQSVSLYPDPNTGDFIIKGALNSAGAKQIFFEVSDVLGQVVYKSDETISNGVLEKHFVLGNSIANGIYLLRISTGGQSQVIRFTISR